MTFLSTFLPVLGAGLAALVVFVLFTVFRLIVAGLGDHKE